MFQGNGKNGKDNGKKSNMRLTRGTLKNSTSPDKNDVTPSLTKLRAITGPRKSQMSAVKATENETIIHPTSITSLIFTGEEAEISLLTSFVFRSTLDARMDN